MRERERERGGVGGRGTGRNVAQWTCFLVHFQNDKVFAWVFNEPKCSVQLIDEGLEPVVGS